jgi:hypothetical protein
MASKKNDYIMENQELISCLTLLMNVCKDKISKKDKNTILKSIDKLKSKSDVVSSVVLYGNAHIGSNRHKELFLSGGYPDNFLLYLNDLSKPKDKFKLKKDKQYRVAIEELKVEPKKRKK